MQRKYVLPFLLACVILFCNTATGINSIIGYNTDILLRAGIFVEYTPQTRIEGEIQQLAADHPVTELWQVITGQAQGRSSAAQVTLFDSVGFAIEDFSALRYIRDQLDRTGHFVHLDLLADPDDPRDLYGMLLRHRPR